MDARGTAAIVTGGASGLGGATAARLAKAGAKVTIFDLNEELGRKHAAEIGGHFVKVNVVDDAAVDAALAEAEGLHGKARICVNCAGIGPPAKVIARDGSPLPLGDFNKIIQVNLIGTFNVLPKFAARLPHRRSDRRGARRHRQHRLGCGLRRPDRPGGLRGLQGRRRRPDAARRARPGAASASASSPSRRASS